MHSDTSDVDEERVVRIPSTRYQHRTGGDATFCGSGITGADRRHPQTHSAYYYDEK